VLGKSAWPALAALAQQVAMPEARCFLIVFGAADKEPSAWDGSITLAGGQVLSLEGWRFGGRDTAGEIGYTSLKPFLTKRVLVEQAPLTQRLTTSEEEQDHPGMAQSGDDVWLSFVEFVHGDRSLATGAFKTAPENFDFLARPVGGDQVFLMHYSKSKRVWPAPVAVTAARQDVMRTAAAVDGSGRVWVFWSANPDGNFDLSARSCSKGAFSGLLRLTSEPGPDLNPVATTDVKGRVWVTWQGFRNGNLEILVAAQDGDGLTPESTVSISPASDWDPAHAGGRQPELQGPPRHRLRPAEPPVGGLRSFRGQVGEGFRRV